MVSTNLYRITARVVLLNFRMKPVPFDQEHHISKHYAWISVFGYSSHGTRQNPLQLWMRKSKSHHYVAFYSPYRYNYKLLQLDWPIS